MTRYSVSSLESFDSDAVGLTRQDESHDIGPARSQGPGELLCLFGSCLRAKRGNGFGGKKRLFDRNQHVAVYIWAVSNFCQCSLPDSDRTTAGYLPRLLNGIDEHLINHMSSLRLNDRQGNPRWCRFCGKSVHDESIYEGRRPFIHPAITYQGYDVQQTFRYTPLDTRRRQIRLVRKLPNVYEYEMQTFDWQSAPVFAALSYMWGDTRKMSNIIINNQPFRVRENLYEFLSTLPRQQNIEWLWVDQLCIDQPDKHERNHQVRLMSRIYGYCAHVLVWLGSDLSTQTSAEVILWRRSIPTSFDALATLLLNPYFSRLWIVQEILLSRRPPRNLCGDTELRWHEIKQLITINGWPDRMLLRKVPHSAINLLLEAVFRRSTAKRPLADCIYHYSANICDRPVDKFYGLLGLVNEICMLEVDYSKDVKTVYYDALLAMIYDPTPPNQLETYESNPIVSATKALFRSCEETKNDVSPAAFIKELQDVKADGIIVDGRRERSGCIKSVGHRLVDGGYRSNLMSE